MAEDATGRGAADFRPRDSPTALRETDAPDAGLTPGRWRVVKRVVQDALDCAPAERRALLDRACAGDAALRREVESLLAAAESSPPGASQATRFLGRAAFALGAATAGGSAPPAALLTALANQFELEGELGRGGMATVYRARDLRHQRPVALKVLRPDLVASLGAARFRREILVAAGLQHPHLVPVLDSGETDGVVWFSMPYVAGESLRHRLQREARLPVADAVRIAREAALALDYAHRHGVVHRDVKPENILLSDGQALVADFGIAKALDTAAGGGSGAPLGASPHGFHTGTGFVVGTPAYMSPEQASGDRALDARADVYALGLVLYEMLAGSAALADPASTAGVPRRFAGTLPPPSAARPEVSPALDDVVARAVRPAPADRFPTAAAFAEALDGVTAAHAGAVTPDAAGRAAPTDPATAAGAAAASGSPRPLAPRDRLATRGRRTAVAGVLALAALAGVVRHFWPVTPATALDPNRVMVFPLAAAGGSLPAGAGEDAATMLGSALDETAPLRWLEAADYVTSRTQADVRALPPDGRRALSAAQRAGFYIDGSVMRRGDSATVVLRLHSVGADTLVARRSATARVGAVSVPDLALRAMGALLVPLLEPGRHVDFSALQDRAPGAIAEFLQGEREYRASHFGRALDHYQAAVARDSLFALAALRGAAVATWVEQFDAATPLTQVALARMQFLPPYRAAFARGIDAYLRGAADSAVADFSRAIAFDSVRSDAWMALGEVYRHLLPRATGLDSLAEQAFVRARRADTTFTPPLYHLAELSLRRGAIARADTFARAYRRADPDSLERSVLDLILRCARDGATASAGVRAVEDAPAISRLNAGGLLADRAEYTPCARTALTSVYAAPSASAGDRWTALFALQNLLVATGRDAEVVRLLRSPAAHTMEAERLLLLDAVAGAAVDPDAAEVARTLGEDYRTMTPYQLWLLGSWESWQGRGDRVRTIARVLDAKADSSHDRGHVVMARSLAARATLAAGDTALAIRQLRALAPSARYEALDEYPWEGLGGERLLLAQLLLARGDYPGAQQAATPLGESHPISYLLYRRAGGLVRSRAAALAAAGARP